MTRGISAKVFRQKETAERKAPRRVSVYSKKLLGIGLAVVESARIDEKDGSLVVEVGPRKSQLCRCRKGAMGAPAVRSFIGGLRAGDRGPYVSTGGLTKEARYEADRANVPVRLVDLDAFVRHYVDVYDKADDDTRSILPLTRIWWPA